MAEVQAPAPEPKRRPAQGGGAPRPGPPAALPAGGPARADLVCDVARAIFVRVVTAPGGAGRDPRHLAAEALKLAEALADVTEEYRAR